MSNKTKKQKALLFDMTRCSGCRSCMEACMAKQGFEGDPKEVEDLSATAYTVVHKKEYDDETWSYRNMCRHCVEPSCVSVCPVAALQKTEEGPVVYDATKCMGCRYCMTACPFNIPRYEWDNPVPAVQKCNMCYDRVLEGKIPACAEACPNEATVFGDRDELLKDAWSRIEEDPDYYHPHVYGEEEVGGTSVLFLAPCPMEELGFDPALGTQPMPEHTWRVLEKIPGIALGAAATMLAFWWITQRRDEVAVHEAAQKIAKNQTARKEDGHERD
jgi:formate dehydrogenase iron-sulfur subunit